MSQVFTSTVPKSGGTFTGAVTFGSTTTTVITGSFIDSVRAAASGQYNFRAGNAVVNNGRYEIVPSTAADGSTFSTYALSVGRGVVAIQAPDGSLGGALQLRNLAASGNYNWQIANGSLAASVFEICVSSATDGSTFSTPCFSLSASGNVVLGTRAALNTNASDGFAYMPTCAGTPTGTPSAVTGKVAWVYDTTNNKIYVYNGAWKATAALT